jgi:hypothetical protein
VRWFDWDGIPEALGGELLPLAAAIQLDLGGGVDPDESSRSNLS